MLKDNLEASLLSLFVLESLPGACSDEQLREILISSGEIEQLSVDGIISSLFENGSIAESLHTHAKYDAELQNSGKKAIVITEQGRAVLSAMADKREFYQSAINRALRYYKKIMYGAQYRIYSEKESGGVRVYFSLLMGDICVFETSLLFSSAAEAKEVLERMENDPDAVYRGFMTVSTGKIEFLG